MRLLKTNELNSDNACHPHLMKKNRAHFGKVFLAASSLLTLGQMAHSQSVFDPNSVYFDELVLGFRKVTPHQANHEVVVDIGPAANYTSLSFGTTINVPNFSNAQLLNAFPDLTFLNWSVLGASDTANGYPNKTLWVTVPRTSPTAQTTAPTRRTLSSQQTAAAQITSILGGGQSFSQNASSNELSNTQYLIQEPINTTGNLSSYIADSISQTNSDLKGTWSQNVENITPSSFSSTQTQITDLYECRPAGYGTTFLDPHTGQTNGPAYYLGYFTLSANGTMTFTRAVQSVYVAPPPASLTVARSGNNTTISFPTTNGATYTLYYTSGAGLTHLRSTWSSLPGTITGNGQTNHFTDTTTDSSRFYYVGAH